MAKPVDESGTEDLVLEDLLPSCEREVCRDDGGLLACSEREMVEEHLRALLVEAHISQLVANDQVKALEAELHVAQRFLCLGLPYSGEQTRYRGEVYGVAFETRLDAQPYGDVRLSRSGVAVHHYAASVPDEVQRLHLGQYHASLHRQLLPLEFLQILHLGEVGPVYARYLASLAPSGDLLLQQPAQEVLAVLRLSYEQPL